MPGCSPTDLFPLLSFSPSHEDSLLGEGPLERPGARLCLTDGPLRTAVKCRYGKRLGLESTAHFLIAGNCSPSELGAVNMGPGPGGRDRSLVLLIGWPPHLPPEWVDGLIYIA